jgi:hypothetical protein
MTQSNKNIIVKKKAEQYQDVLGNRISPKLIPENELIPVIGLQFDLAGEIIGVTVLLQEPNIQIQIYDLDSIELVFTESETATVS